MTVGQYIISLIDKYDCVIVPDFGAFISNYRNSTIQESSIVTIIPPRKHLLFNATITMDDGILINYIAKQELLTYKDAKTRVDEYVKDISKGLKKSSFYCEAGLGDFKINKSGKIQFEPKYTDVSLPEFFGLPSLQFSVVSESNSVKIKPIKFSRKVLKRVAILSPFVIATALLPTDFYNGLQKSSFISTPQNNVIKLSNDDDLITEIDDTQKMVLKVLEESTSREAALLYEEPHDYRYHIILGSFKDRKNAQLFVNKVNQLGLKPQIIVKGNYFRVSLSSFTTKDEAKLEIVKIKDNSKFKDAWIFDAN